MIPRSFFQSFTHAFRGLAFTFISEKNMRVHSVIAVMIAIAALYLKFSYHEWLVLILTIFLVLIAETINTAIEINVDLVTKKKRLRAMLAKDAAAAAVLLSALNAIIIGVFLFYNKIFN